MGHDSLIVLKFGSSVLGRTGDARGLSTAVQEIYRWRREGWRVIAVVSAAKGATDALLGEARALCPRPQRAARSDASAQLAATGELAAAARLVLALDGAGVPAETLDAGAIALRTSGPCLDASPVSLDEGAVHGALDRAGVLVVPGFIGRDEHGRTTLLGRGGSDLSALFIAHALGVRCRLLKDTPGLFETDPKRSTCLRDSRSGLSRCEGSPTTDATGAPRSAEPDLGDPPNHRYSRLHWNDLPRLGARAVQPKAAVFAWENQVEFEVASPLAEACTVVGKAATVIAHTPVSEPRPVRVALLGHGVVGAGVARALVELGRTDGHAACARFEITAIAVRTPAKHAPALLELGLDITLLTTDAAGALATHPDLIIECLGGLEPASGIIERALRAGVHVVTANKAVIAERGPRLHAIAAAAGATLAYSAAVGGAVPALELVRAIARSGGTGVPPVSRVASIRAVLNGTSNFVLSRLGAGVSFADAVNAAQAAGFAEADPSRDLSGLDALDKLRILADAAYPSGEGGAGPVTTRLVGIDESTVAQARDAARRGLVVRQVARLTRTRDGGGGVHFSVAPEVLDPATPADAPLANLADEANALVVTDAAGVCHILAGRGAGRTPTALSVLADVFDAPASLERPRQLAGESPRAPAISLRRERRTPLVTTAEDNAPRRAAG